MTFEQVRDVHGHIQDMQLQYAGALRHHDIQRRLESSDELSVAFTIIGNAPLAQKWTDEYHRAIGHLLRGRQSAGIKPRAHILA